MPKKPINHSGNSRKKGISLIENTTEHKIAEKELRKSEEQFQDLFSSMREGFALCEVILDKKGKPVDYRFLKINPAFGNQSSMDVQASTGKTIKQIYPDIEQKWIDRYCKVGMTRKPIHFIDYNHNTKRYYDVVAFSPSKGKFAMLFEDITGIKNVEKEKEQLSQQLMQADKMASIGTLTAGVAHEFNNILAIINGSTELGRMSDSIEKKNIQYDKILIATERASEIVQNLATFSKPGKPTKKRCNLNKAMERVLKLIENQYEKQNVKIEKKFSGIPDVSINEQEIQEVFLNILVNARDSMMKKGGTITIETSSSNKYVEISISDTGCGIKANKIKRVFEPFYTTKGPLGGNDEVLGTGLGLSVSYGIIQRHKGTIEVESNLYEGTTFTIKLPIKRN